MLTPEILLQAYAAGIFPMAERRESVEVHWIDPPLRGIFPLGGFRISRSLRRTILRSDYDVRVNTDFSGTMAACANREETWINPTIRDLCVALHAAGHAHSVEVWRDGVMVGGVYGLTIGSAFFGESMFSLQRDASKIALAWLIHRLNAGGFTLFDTQFQTPHLQSLGAIEIPKRDYLRRLDAAMEKPADFLPDGYQPTPEQVAGQLSQDSTHTS